MGYRTLFFAAAVAAGVVGGQPALCQQLPSGPSWYRTKDMNLDARLHPGSVELGPQMYASKDPLLGICKPGDDWGMPHLRIAGEFASLLNAQRLSLGIPPLNVDRALTAASVWKSMHMAKYNYFGHSDPAPPEARTAFQRALECGYGRYIAENLAEGQDSAHEAMSDWLDSPDHRRNMDNPAYTDMGVGVATAPNGDEYWTLDLGRKE